MCKAELRTDYMPGAFDKALRDMLTHDKTRDGIGTLGEKSLHSVIKHYISPNEDTHEIKCGRFVADILVDGRIFEVQTRGFYHLQKKLEYFLPLYRVTVVYPIPEKKWVVKMNRHTGECSPNRRSPKKATVYSVFDELYQIRKLLLHPHFAVRLLSLEVTDYRITSGNAKDRGEKFERMPSALLGDITLSTKEDYLALLPATLPSPFFTSKDLKIHAKIPLATSQRMLLVLTEMDAVKRVGKTGNSYLYEKAD